MNERKSYGQFCGLARSLDRIGDRWTLLVVRELLLGPKTFRELERGLEGISPALLTQRITTLLGDGLAERNEAPQRSKAVRYELTSAGYALDPVVLELIRWGTRWMMPGPGNDRCDPTWAPLALRALIAGQPGPARTVVHVDIVGTWTTVRSRGGKRAVSAGREGAAQATVAADLPTVLAVVTGAARLGGSGATVVGDGTAAARMLEPAPDR